MTDPLATYLHDHLAGSDFAVDLLENLSRQHAKEPLGEFAAQELLGIKEERAVLQRIIDQIRSEGAALKQAATWIGEKISRFKLTHAGSDHLGDFQALETLALGVVGRVALWRALAVIAPVEDRLRGLDFQALAARAEAQHIRVEKRRLEIAPAALRPRS